MHFDNPTWLIGIECAFRSINFNKSAQINTIQFLATPLSSAAGIQSLLLGSARAFRFVQPLTQKRQII
jgi:hypothetical protein